jgi:hypothetical protein
MNICGHDIKASEIIGVGPLMLVSTGDNMTKACYNPKRYEFLVHTKNQSIKIESDSVPLAGVTSEGLAKNKNYLVEFVKEYGDVKQKILELIKD